MKIKDMKIGVNYHTELLLEQADEIRLKAGTYCLLTLADADGEELRAVCQTDAATMNPLVGGNIELIIQMGEKNGRTYYAIPPESIKAVPKEDETNVPNASADEDLPFDIGGDDAEPVVDDAGEEEARAEGDKTEEVPQEGQTESGETPVNPVYPKISDMEMDRKYDMVLRLRSADEKAAKNGPYCSLSLSDTDFAVISANAFSTEKKTIENLIGEIVHVTIRKGLYNGSPSYTVDGNSLKKAEGADIAQFVERAPIEPEAMYDEIVGMLVGGRPATVLARKLYEDNKEKLFMWPAAQKLHHNYLYGLLYHTLSIMRTAVGVCSVYPLDKDLLLAGAAIHDIGKLVELDARPTGDAEYSLEGDLEGHIFIGYKMLLKTALALDAENGGALAESEDFSLLEHMILSHHGIAEWGSVKSPMFPEAFVLHVLDNLDAKLEIFRTSLANTEPGHVTEERSRVLGTRLYKPVPTENKEGNSNG